MQLSICLLWARTREGWLVGCLVSRGMFVHAPSVCLSVFCSRCAVPRVSRYDPAEPPHGGLSVARQIAMFTYRSAAAYEDKFGRRTESTHAGQGQDVRPCATAQRMGWTCSAVRSFNRSPHARTRTCTYTHTCMPVRERTVSRPHTTKLGR